jgi:hypothetical protein
MQFFLLAYAVNQYTGRQSLQSSDEA